MLKNLAMLPLASLGTVAHVPDQTGTQTKSAPATRPAPQRLPHYHPQFRRSRYMPHQGAQERFRRWKRMELKRGGV